MRKYARNFEIERPPDGHRTRLRSRVRDFGSMLATPLGTSCLAVFSLFVGLYAGGSIELPGSELDLARERIEEQSAQIQDLRGKLTLEEIEAQRLRAVQGYSAEYDIPADLAASVYDVALSEDVDPQLAFRLVRTESSFRRYAVSSAGAVGYTQIKPSTARLLDPSVTYEQLFLTETNLRLGFRYLRLLLERYDRDFHLALTAYNRGPTRVGSLLALEQDPSNGYARRVLDGIEPESLK